MAAKVYKFLNYFFGLSDRIFHTYNPVKVFQYNYRLYVFTGFWKYQSVNAWKTYLYKLYQNSVIIIYGLSMGLFVVDAIDVRNDLVKLSFNMSSSILVITKILQVILLWNFKDDVDGICDKLDHHLYVGTVGLSEEDKSILKQKAETLLNITSLFYGLLLMGLPLRVLADTALDTRAYLIPMPFKEKIKPYYGYLYAQQVILSFHFMVTTLAYDLFGFMFMLRFIGHYEILKKNFLKIKTLYPRRNFEKYVRGYFEVNKQADAVQDVLIRKANYSEKIQKCLENYKVPQFNLVKWVESERCREEKTSQLLKENVNHHQKLITEITNFSNIYSRPLLIQVFGLVILVGIAALQILFISNEINPLFLQQLLYASTTLMNIIFLCSFGSELTSKSLSAANALYDIPWYDMNIDNRGIVCLMLKELIKAPKLRGGGMISIDRVTFVKFIQYAYNMVAILRNKI